MPTQHVIVKFPRRRAVFIDDQESGFTNNILRTNTGTHKFNLGNPRDYKPKWRRRIVEKTTSVKPMEIIFEEL